MKELFPGLRQSTDIASDGESSTIFVVGDGEDIALVDSGPASRYQVLKAELVRSGIDPADVKDMYITHGHSDHYESVALFRRDGYMPDVYIGEADRRAVEKGEYFGTAGFFYGKHTLPVAETFTISNGYERRFGSVMLRAVEAPGHTPGSMAYVLENDGLRVGLLGDLGWGGWHPLIGSDFTKWEESVDTLQGLDLTHVSFGHGPTRLIEAKPHLHKLRQQIGKYANAYDNIPASNFNPETAKPSE